MTFDLDFVLRIKGGRDLLSPAVLVPYDAIWFTVVHKSWGGLKVQSAYIARSHADSSILGSARQSAAITKIAPHTLLQMTWLKQQQRKWLDILLCDAVLLGFPNRHLLYQVLLSILDISVEVSINLYCIFSFSIHQNHMNFTRKVSYLLSRWVWRWISCMSSVKSSVHFVA